MAMPFYVSPEQMMQDRAEYAKKGIAKGRSIIAMEYDQGVLFVADNPSTSLFKISEIYDNIAFQEPVDTANLKAFGKPASSMPI